MYRGEGFFHYPGLFSMLEQYALLTETLTVAREAPFMAFRLSDAGDTRQVETTAAGALGWSPYEQQPGYRDTHPVTNRPWPPLGPMMAAAVDRLLAMAGDAIPGRLHPDCCLISRYREGGRGASYQDDGEAVLEAPMLCISLGDTARFLLGGPGQDDSRREVLLQSGDGLVLAGAARGYCREVAGLLAGSSELVPGGGRISLCIHQVWRRDENPNRTDNHLDVRAESRRSHLPPPSPPGSY